MRKFAPNHFRDQTKVFSNPPLTRAPASVGNFATFQKTDARDDVPKPCNANRRPQLLQILQQLPGRERNPDQLLQNLRQLAARALAEQADEWSHRTLDTQPLSVATHFDEAVKKPKQLAQPKKKMGKEPEGGK